MGAGFSMLGLSGGHHVLGELCSTSTFEGFYLKTNMWKMGVPLVQLRDPQVTCGNGIGALSGSFPGPS